MIFSMYKGKLSQLLFEDVAGFHGFKMTPKAMKGIELCSVDSFDPNTSPDSRGCPQFTDEAEVTDGDIDEAVQYLNKVKPVELIAYSRGTSVLIHALGNPELKHVPGRLFFIAPAWKRWGSNYDSGLAGQNIKKATCRVVIGCCDHKVPVKHAKELADFAGVQLEILLGYDHVLGKDLFKGKSKYFNSSNPTDVDVQAKQKLLDVIKSYNIGSSKKNSPARVKSGGLGFIWDGLRGETVPFPGGDLPEWGNKSFATPEQLIQQIEVCHGKKAPQSESRLYRRSLARAIFS